MNDEQIETAVLLAFVFGMWGVVVLELIALCALLYYGVTEVF